jgi:PhzF family phenazine biosynthesis protein
MRIPYYQVDVFSGSLFKGNPAGVCLLPEDWLPDDLMLQIAFENNLSETAFVVRRGEAFHLRWFTPNTEMDLCGHATIAPAHVLLTETGLQADAIAFETQSGPVRVDVEQDLLVLDFPSRPPEDCPGPEDLERAMGRMPSGVQRSRDYLLIYADQDEVLALAPDFGRIAAWEAPGVIATAPGRTADFVSRFFAPRVGVNEDPATGSSHSTLVPYWARRLGKANLHAFQLSARGGELFCRDAGSRVRIGGRAVTYLRGEIDTG